jgi:ATP adenylyltransferase/5',5'''-P-1,P-4-tetraphosphate phosphorylase II
MHIAAWVCSVQAAMQLFGDWFLDKKKCPKQFAISLTKKWHMMA